MDPNESFHNIIMILELIFMKFQVGMEKMAEKLRGFVMWVADVLYMLTKGQQVLTFL